MRPDLENPNGQKEQHACLDILPHLRIKLSPKNYTPINTFFALTLLIFIS
jgi:hypothetical protein